MSSASTGSTWQTMGSTCARRATSRTSSILQSAVDDRGKSCADSYRAAQESNKESFAAETQLRRAPVGMAKNPVSTDEAYTMGGPLTSDPTMVAQGDYARNNGVSTSLLQEGSAGNIIYSDQDHQRRSHDGGIGTIKRELASRSIADITMSSPRPDDATARKQDTKMVYLSGMWLQMEKDGVPSSRTDSVRHPPDWQVQEHPVQGHTSKLPSLGSSGVRRSRGWYAPGLAAILLLGSAAGKRLSVTSSSGGSVSTNWPSRGRFMADTQPGSIALGSFDIDINRTSGHGNALCPDSLCGFGGRDEHVKVGHFDLEAMVRASK
eukprot:2741159-Amphidinium_carterae.1